jgi:hypothetical protein
VPFSALVSGSVLPVCHDPRLYGQSGDADEVYGPKQVSDNSCLAQYSTNFIGGTPRPFFGKWTAFIQRFSNQCPALYYLTFTHSCTHSHRRRCQPCEATASLSRAVRVRCLAQGHLDTQLGGAGDQTSNLLVTSQPALPPD